MICINCKKKDNDIQDGNEVVVEVIGPFRSREPIESQCANNDISLRFTGYIAHVDCHTANQQKRNEVTKCTP